MNKNYFLIIIITSIFIFFVNSSQDLTNNDCKYFRGSNRNGIIKDLKWNPVKINKNPQYIWKIKLGDGYSAVAFKDKNLYTMGYIDGKDNIYCIDINTGKTKWRYSYDCKRVGYNGPRSTPSIDELYVYTLSQDGKLFCLNAITGKLIWKKDIQKECNTVMPRYGYTSSPIIKDNLLLLNVNKAGLALNKYNGDIIWDTGHEVCGYASPVVFIYNNKEYAAMYGASRLYILHINTGKIISSYLWDTHNGNNIADPLIINNKIFISSGYDKGCALLIFEDNQLKKIWQNNYLNTHFTTSIYLNGFIYGIHGNSGRKNPIQSFVCLDDYTGYIKWKKEMKIGSFILVNDDFLILDERGGLQIIKASSNVYEEIASCNLESGIYWTAPVLWNGKLFIRNSQKGELYCINVSK